MAKPAAVLFKIVLKFLSWCPSNIGILTGMLQAIYENPSIICRLLFYAPFTPAILSSQSSSISQQSAPSSPIATIQEILINGVFHSILLRGHSSSLPVILVLHGGPGATDIPFHSSYGQYLEQDYLLIHYDQRGACKTGHKYCHQKNFDQTLTIQQHVDDVIAIAEWIKTNFSSARDGIYLIGGSWGSMLALETVKQRPDLFLKVLLRGAVTNSPKSEQDGMEFIQNRLKYFRYSKSERDSVFTHLSHPYQSITHLLKQREYLSSLGGMDYQTFQASSPLPKWFLTHSMSYSLFKCPEISLSEIVTMKGCMVQSLQAMWGEVEQADMIERIHGSIEIPVAIVHGKHDYCTSHLLVEEFLKKLIAPEKYLIWFRHSG
jgi:pimeloyl-ACP methyl ester carboxylesterase